MSGPRVHRAQQAQLRGDYGASVEPRSGPVARSASQQSRTKARKGPVRMGSREVRREVVRHVRRSVVRHVRRKVLGV